jgi:2-C-methyl-D-erythritol 4-phosphate cytidylyltransferase
VSGALYAVVPAAGRGSRMGGEVPKQYLDLAGRSVLEHALWRLAPHPLIARVVVAIAEDDRRFAALAPRLPPKIATVTGGVERCHSVLAGLAALAVTAAPDDWVLVHDAARPCLRRSDLDRLIETATADPVGAILAVPVRDTLKRADDACRSAQTVDRTGLWHALTPQMFRLDMLRRALEQALAAERLVTDEAEAIEAAGSCPRLVAAHGDNIKITHPEDLGLAALILRAQAAHERGVEQ